MRRLFLATVLAMSFAAPTVHATPEASKPAIVDIQDLPRLRPGLPVGTVAWATIYQIHPTQPEVGFREVERKKEMFKSLLKDHGKKFSEKLYEFAFQHSVSPVYIAKTPEIDPRFGEGPGKEKFLGYISDRTHGSTAQARMILEVYGERALSEPIFDEKGRPLNFVLVRVMGDKSDESYSSFKGFMKKKAHEYLNLWRRGYMGGTEIVPIDFDELPPLVLGTTENPWRDIVGELQHAKMLGRSATDFSQFIMAKALLESGKLTWDEVSSQASEKTFKHSMKVAKDFFDSPAAKDLPGVKPDEDSAASSKQCRAVFKK